MTEERKKAMTFGLTLLGGLLILLNVMLIGISNRPVMISTFGANSPSIAWNSSAPTWGRIAFGFYDSAAGIWPVVGMVVAALMIYCGLLIYFRPRVVNVLSTSIMLLSAISLLYGGGFIVGSILAFIAGASAYEKRKEFKQSFIGRMLSAARMDSRLFAQLAENASPRDGAMAILFVNLLAGIGNALYGFNVQQVLEATTTKIPFEIILAGRINFDYQLISTPITLMGLGIAKWVILSLVLFVVGVKLFGEKASLSSISACAGLAYAPVSLQLFTPFIFTNKEFLTDWPLVVYFVTNLWLAVILTFGIRHVFSMSLTRAAGVVALGGGIYYLINYVVFMPLAVPFLIRFNIQPQETLLLITSAFLVISPFFIRKRSS